MYFMKLTRITILAATFFALMSAPAFAQTKIATVDMKKVFNGYWKKKEAENLLDKSKVDRRKDLKDMSDNLDKTQADYKQLLDQANDPAISAEERDKRKTAATAKAKEFNSQKVEFEQYQRSAESSLQDKSQRMSANLLAEIQKAVGDQAKVGGYALVLNSAAIETVVYTDSSTDITDTVLKQLNAGAPIDVTKPATGLPLNISTNLP
jgi:outer membrane protein